jgi:hypothetical protein
MIKNGSFRYGNLAGHNGIGSHILGIRPRVEIRHAQKHRDKKECPDPQV